jgi:anti-sigma-K factor RskA
MSGTGPEDQAGLYVLGALNAEEMRAIRIAAGRDPALGAEIAAWERRLAPLALLVPEQKPPASVWTQLEARLTRMGAGAASAEFYQPPPQRPRQRRSKPAGGLIWWQGATAAALALAAGLAVFMVRRPPEPIPHLAMVLPAKAGVGGWLVELPGKGEIKVHATGALSRRLDQDYELWAMPEGTDTPLPLGLLPVNASAVLKVAHLPRAKFQLLVSLEPKGGSPSGLPTGPVLFAGDVVAP